MEKFILFSLFCTLSLCSWGQELYTKQHLQSCKEEVLREISRLLDHQDSTETVELSRYQLNYLKNERTELDTLKHPSAQQIANSGYVIACAYTKSPKNTQAFSWFMHAAELGDPRSQYNIGLSFEYGYLGQQVDMEKAIEWYLRAIKKENVKSIINLGNIYYRGKGVKQDFAKAYQFFQQAADRGEKQAQSNLGTMYAKGQFVTQDMNKAIDFWLKAAEMGKYDCYNTVGAKYYTGDRVKRNRKKAFYYFQLGQQQGDTEATTHAGICYYYGHGVKKDYDQAFQLFTLIEDEQKTGVGCYALGECYRHGHGVDRNYETAAHWYNQALKRGYSDAEKELRKLKKKTNKTK